MRKTVRCENRDDDNRMRIDALLSELRHVRRTEVTVTASQV